MRTTTVNYNWSLEDTVNLDSLIRVVVINIKLINPCRFFRYSVTKNRRHFKNPFPLFLRFFVRRLSHCHSLTDRPLSLA